MKNFLIIEERFCGKTYSAQNHMLKGNNYSEITTVNNLVFWLFFKKKYKSSVHTPRLDCAVRAASCEPEPGFTVA